MDLTLKYRPKTFDDVVGQTFITNILKRQITTNTFKNTYLFCGSFGCGKTTCARILANEINKGQGSPIEIDGASNNGVDNIRDIVAVYVYAFSHSYIRTQTQTDTVLSICTFDSPPQSFVRCIIFSKKDF